ncbi:YbaN family protein [Tropicimonas marinistellae]|uniref:YbaN family protein n=1 Tax=Tropicimonas marinistellae TaxID=1739787 RepID=UPI0008331488|nr:YbaN family protein [Tropicimonas marinistellae]
MRVLWAIGGVSSLGLGTLGAVLPLLPTVPFVLLAAYCFSRSSDRMHDWLLDHNIFGPMIHNWRESGAIGLRAKRLATVTVAAVFGLSILMGVRPILLAIQAAVLGAVLIFIWSRPTGSR